MLKGKTTNNGQDKNRSGQTIRKCVDLKVDDSAGRGRPRKSWLECVNDNMKKLGLKCRDGTR